MVSSPSHIAVALVALLPRVAFAIPKASFESTKTYGAIPVSVAFDYSPAPTYNPEEHLKFVNIFKRGCTLPQGITCFDGNACCNNPKDSSDGWCCGTGKICGNGDDGAYCGYSTVYTTVTTTEVNTVSDLNTVTESSAGSTETETITSTEIVTTTVSNVDTATEVVTITVTRAVKKRAAATNLPASVEVYPTARQHQLPVLAKATPTTTPQAQSPRGFHVRDLLRRQDASTVVSTIFVTEQSTTTTSGDTTITNFYTETETSTFVSTIVFTSAIDAKTTVQSTFTLTVDQANTNAASSAANTGQAGSSTGSAQSQQTTGAAATGGGGNGSSGLSTGAKAGIGAGVAGVAVIAGIFFAFMLLARRKKNKKLVASSNPAPGAGPNAAYSNIQNNNASGVPSELHGGTASGYAHDVKYAQVAPVGVAPANHNNIHYNQDQNYPQQSELDSTTLATPLSSSYRQPSPGHSELSSTSPIPQYAHPAPGPNVYEMQSQSVNAYQAPGGFASELDGQGGRR